MWKLQPLKFCLLSLLTALVCLVTSPSLALLPRTDSIPPLAQHTAPTAESLEQQGRSLYTNGQFSQAITAFQQAAQAYAAQGSLLKQAIVLSNLALTYQQLGQWTEANQAITTSLVQLEAGLEQEGSPDRTSALAQALDIQGSLYLAQGNAQAAFETWERSIALYDQLGDQQRATQSRMNQAQALQTLGLYRRAIETVLAALGWPLQALADSEMLQSQLQNLPDSPMAMVALQSLGEALRVTGRLELSRAVLQQNLQMAQRSQQPEAIATTQLKLGNLTRTEAFVGLSRSNLTLAEAVELVRRGQQGDRRIGIEEAEAFYAKTDQALVFYRQAASISTSANTRIQAQLNQLRLLVETDRQAEALNLLSQVQPDIDILPPVRAAIEARINLARSLMEWGSGEWGMESGEDSQSPTPQTIAQLLATAIQQARDLQAPRAESYALGYLGELYEQTEQWSDAEQITRQALWLAQSNDASDIAYQWQWQLGRILKTQWEATGKRSQDVRDNAIAAYTEAVNTLKSIRSDLIAITPEEQLSFRNTIEPIYRQLVTLLLQSQQTAPDRQNLNAARNVIESLQLAELDNFFREACLNSNPTLIDQVDRQAAILYPIILPDQLAVIVSLPQSSQSDSPQPILDYYTTPISQEEVEATVSLLRDSLDQANDNRFLPPAQQLYNWLLRPVQEQLETQPVDTLVFVLDGVLRNIPMAVLHDGQQYLAEKPYSVALTPGLQLLGTQPLAQEQLRSALLAGITEARPGFSALPSVRDELAQIQAEIPETTTLLDDTSPTSEGDLTINGEFTSANFQTAIQTTPFPIVHLATHGQFSSQLEETYLLTEDGRLNIEDLRTSLQTTAIRQNGTLELLVLSACETATGDEQAALGLAGVAVRAGARSTVATLWQVNDYSSAIFMGKFYQELANVRAFQITKAEALHRAQRSLLQNPEYQHPYFWAPYVLIGNWR